MEGGAVPGERVSRYACLCGFIPQVCADVFLPLINQTFTNHLLCAEYWLRG